MALEIFEILSLRNGKTYFQVIDNDGHKFPIYGIFKTLEQAQKLMITLRERRKTNDQNA